MSSPDLIDQERELMAYAGPDRVVHVSEYLATKSAENLGITKYFTGWPQFDERLDGVVGGEVTVFTGSTGQGKTTVVETAIQRLITLNDGLSAAMFSFEVSAEALLAKHDQTSPIYLPLELKAMDPSWLEERIEEAKVKYGCQVIMVDHLHFLVDMASKQNMSLNIGAFMRKLTLIAKRLNVAIFLIAHQNAESGKKGNEEPSIENIRDSSFVAQEAANVIIIWRRKDFSGDELQTLAKDNPVLAHAVRSRIDTSRLPGTDDYQDGFAMVQIAKARRKGTFRWKKLFQKVGPFFEEV